MTEDGSGYDANRRLAGRTCIVTGAASGIGRAIARLFARHGANVIVADIGETVLEGAAPTVDLIRSEGGAAVFRQTTCPTRRPSTLSSPTRSGATAASS